MIAVRLDLALIERGILNSRERAKEMIKNGQVSVNGVIIIKPAEKISETDEIILIGEKLKYVGRGGLKLEKAVNFFGLDISGKTCIDIGASTGGFTDCMLQNDAEKVYSIDVGHSQLAESLLNDSRVINLEKTDVREITADRLEGKADFIATDVSFISLKLILPKIAELLEENGKAVVLIKPQFEAGRQNIGKNGIVKSERVHISVINDILDFSQSLGFFISGICGSPIKGGKGNTEYLLCLSLSFENNIPYDIKELVHKELKEVSINL